MDELKRNFKLYAATLCRKNTVVAGATCDGCFLWDAETGISIARLQSCWNSACTNDGANQILCGQDFGIQAWDLRTHEKTFRFENKNVEFVESVVVSKND